MFCVLQPQRKEPRQEEPRQQRRGPTDPRLQGRLHHARLQVSTAEAAQSPILSVGQHQRCSRRYVALETRDYFSHSEARLPAFGLARVIESGEKVRLAVLRKGDEVSLSCETQVDYETHDGTAHAGVNYEAVKVPFASTSYPAGPFALQPRTLGFGELKHRVLTSSASFGVPAWRLRRGQSHSGRARSFSTSRSPSSTTTSPTPT